MMFKKLFQHQTYIKQYCLYYICIYCILYNRRSNGKMALHIRTNYGSLNPFTNLFVFDVSHGLTGENSEVSKVRTLV